MEASETKKNFTLVCLFLLSLSLRLIKLILDPVLTRDSALYITLAKEWANNGFLQNNEYNVPLLPIYAMKEADCFIENTEIAGRSIALFLGSLIPVIGYVISKNLFKDKKKAIICTLILMLHPNLISYSTQPLRESPYLFFEGLILLALIKGIKNRKYIFWLLSGVLSALAFYCRLEALEFTLIIPLFIVYFILNKDICLRKASIFISLFYLSFFLSFFMIPFLTDINMSFVLRILVYTKDVF
jgi:dolichyl-phosphate-mannose--protein O-mannosyl transferase